MEKEKEKDQEEKDLEAFIDVYKRINKELFISSFFMYIL